MRVLKKISTPFIDVDPEKAIILINLVDPQVNTIKPFIQACRDYKIHYRAFANKIDYVKDYKTKISKLQEAFGITDITAISTLKGTNMELVRKQIESWDDNRIIILGVFNSGKTSLINHICKK